MATAITECRSVFADDGAAGDGIGFGSTPDMTPYTPRQRDRRQAMSDLLASLARALDRRLDVSLIRGAFETALGQIIPVRSVHLRDIGSRFGTRPDTPAPESVVLEVPGADPC